MSDPEVKWVDGEIQVSLPQPGTENVIEASWVPPGTYIVKLRKVGEESWGPGFETPITGCRFVDLEPDTEYETQLVAKNSAELRSEPVVTRFKTGADGESVN